MMRGHFRVVSLVAVIGTLAALGFPSWAQGDSERRISSDNPSLVIVLDGLRPESLTPALMPNLHSLSKKGAALRGHHAVYPTVAVVNAASIATGTYPSTHGLLGDTIVLSQGDVTAMIETLKRLQSPTEGGLLTAPSLGEIFAARDKRVLVVSSGEAAASFVLGPGNQGGGFIHPDIMHPRSLGVKIIETLGPVPGEDSTGNERDGWAVDAYLDVGLPQIKPDVAILWLAEPAQTQLEAGLGSPQSIEAVREVDKQIGRVLRRHKKLRLKVNVFVTSARGFSSRTGNDNLSRFLVTEGLKANVDSRDVVVADNCSIFVEGQDRSRIRGIVERLQRLEWVGAIYTQQVRPTHPESFVRGALSFQSVYMDHPRAPDILVEPAWSEEQNEQGSRGTTRGFGKAGGGSSSPYDLRTILVAAGPDIKRGLESAVPSAHIDLAPTLCFLHGIEPPATMDGRVLYEALRGGPKPGSIEVLHRRHGSEATWEGGGYRLIMTEMSVEGVDYLDFTKVEDVLSR